MTQLIGTDTWVAISGQPLPTSDVAAWIVTPSCGAVSTFVGTVRDHSPGRPGIIRLDYEAHVELAELRLAAIANAARERWPEIGRIALLHRTGSLGVGGVATVVAVSTPHRREAIAATAWAIDTLKATVPIWKYEVWEGGAGWGECTHDLVDVDELHQSTAHDHDHDHDHAHDRDHDQDQTLDGRSLADTPGLRADDEAHDVPAVAVGRLDRERSDDLAGRH